MKVAITGASGFVGQALQDRLRASGHEVAAVSTRNGIRKDAVAGAAAVVHLAGEPIAQRWTSSARERIRRSRVDGTRELVEALRADPPAVLVSASAVGYYGSRGNQQLTEASRPGDDFLAQVAVEWEREAQAAASFGVRVVIPRLGVVLGKNGGALARMLLPFRLGVGGRLGSGKQWMSWIHLGDLTALLEFALCEATLSGPVNAVAPHPVTNAEFTRTLARALHRPAVLPVPAFGLKLLLGKMSQVILEGQKVYPETALRCGFPYRYPGLREALDEIFG